MQAARVHVRRTCPRAWPRSCTSVSHAVLLSSPLLSSLFLVRVVASHLWKAVRGTIAEHAIVRFPRPRLSSVDSIHVRPEGKHEHVQRRCDARDGTRHRSTDAPEARTGGPEREGRPGGRGFDPGWDPIEVPFAGSGGGSIPWGGKDTR